MESAEQQQGEKRVMEVLIEPLDRVGLAKPSTLTKAEFEKMRTELCAKLAYMDAANLAALAEQVQANPAGPNKDRFPIAAHILRDAADIQPPGDDGSPLVRAVFRAPLGLDALGEGWSPELLRHLKRMRRWPNAYVLTQIKKDARDAIRRLDDLDRIVARGDVLGSDDESWRTRRRAALDRCRHIADLAKASEGEA